MVTLADPAHLIPLARTGNRGALDGVLRVLADLVYPLADCMLGSPRAADSATQTILIQLVSALGSARHDHGLRAWVYRVASAHLLARRDAPDDRPRMLLLVLDREQRIAFALGDVLAVQIDEAEAALAWSPGVFRATRCRARAQLRDRYGLVDVAALCRSATALGAPATLADSLRALLTGCGGHDRVRE